MRIPSPEVGSLTARIRVIRGTIIGTGVRIEVTAILYLLNCRTDLICKVINLMQRIGVHNSVMGILRIK
jgi:hypothetical protein